MADLSFRVEYDDGLFGWRDLSPDVVGSVKASWGIHGSTPKDRVAEPGEMSFELDNSDGNIIGKEGAYTPGHQNARRNFVLGAPVRLVLSHPLYGEKVRWLGTIEDIDPPSGVRRRDTAVKCVDWMEEAARARLAGVPVQVDAQSDVLFSTLVDVVETPPPGGVSAGSGSDVYPYALDSSQDEQTTVLTEFQKLAMSEFGMIYVAAGVAVFEGRKRRGGGGGVRYVLDEDEQLLSVGVAYGRDQVLNRAQVTIHPRRRDAAATTVLFELTSPLEIARGLSVTIDCPYRDPNQKAQRVGGVDMVTPVASTDYTFNSAEDGTGVDLTAQLTVAATFGGNSAKVTITNNGPFDGYIPAGELQLRGRGLYDFEPVVIDRTHEGSFANYGENAYPYDMPYQVSVANAIDLAQFILDLNAAPETRAETVTFLGNWDDEATENLFNLEISDRVQIEARSLWWVSGEVTGSPRVCFVNGITLDIRSSGLVFVTLDLAPVSTAQFWLLEIDGRTELDQTTTLGYGLFVPGWVLDESELGTETFLN